MVWGGAASATNTDDTYRSDAYTPERVMVQKQENDKGQNNDFNLNVGVHTSPNGDKKCHSTSNDPSNPQNHRPENRGNLILIAVIFAIGILGMGVVSVISIVSAWMSIGN